MVGLSKRSLSEWKKFKTFADWERTSISDEGQFVKFAVSAFRDGDVCLEFLFESDLSSDQIGSELGQRILDLSSMVRDALVYNEKLEAEAIQ